jgi:hypothetical protein
VRDDNFIINNNGNGGGVAGVEGVEDPAVAKQDRPFLPEVPYVASHAVQYKEAIEFFKKAERIVEEELMISTKNQRISQLAGVTFNNLACYYKKYTSPHAELNGRRWPSDTSNAVLNWRSTKSTIGSPPAVPISTSAPSTPTSASTFRPMQA